MDIDNSARVLSIFMIIGGSVLYVYSKSQAPKPPAKPEENHVEMGSHAYDKEAYDEKKLKAVINGVSDSTPPSPR